MSFLMSFAPALPSGCNYWWMYCIYRQIENSWAKFDECLSCRAHMSILASQAQRFLTMSFLMSFMSFSWA